MYTLQDFFDAYRWMYGYTLTEKEMRKALGKMSYERAKAIIDCYKSNCKKAFYED